MADNQNLSPFPWRPVSTPTPIKGSGPVSAGDWITIFVNYRASNATRGGRVQYLPNRFFVHVLYTPSADDSTQHEDQSVTYGGSATNRQREYRINPGWCFQAPFDGRLSIVAGGDAPDTTETDVLVVKGFAPRLWQEQQALIRQTQQRAEMGDMEALMAMASLNPIAPPRAERRWAPPIIGVPQLVPATWIAITGGGGGLPAIPFPDGAVSVCTVADARVRLTVNALGQTLPFDLPPNGTAVPLGSFGQGNAGTDGTPATWTSATDLSHLTVWSSLGG